MTQRTPKQYRILSILSPVLIFSAVFFSIYPEYSPLGGSHSTMPVRIQEITDRLQETNPEIIIVGASIANKSIDETLLAKELGLTEGSIQKVWSGRARMPTVMLMVQKRILEAGIKPKTILVVTTPRWMLSNEIIDQQEFNMHWTGELSPSLGKVLHVDSYWKRNYVQKRGETQDNIEKWIRYWFGEKPFAISEDELNTRLDAVFDDQNKRKDQLMEQKLIQHNVKNTEIQEEDSVETIPAEDELLVLPLIEEARAAGINIILVEMPVADPIKHLHAIPEDLAVTLIGKYAERGAGHLYYFDWDTKGLFADMHHMNQIGRAKFTEMLAKDLQKIGALQEEIKPVELPKELSRPVIEWSEKKTNRFGDEVLLKGGTVDILFPHPWINLELELCASGRKKPKTSLIRFQGKELQTQKKWGTELWCETLKIDTVEKNQRIQIINEQKDELVLHRIRANQIDLLEAPQRIVVKPEISIIKENERQKMPIEEKKNPPPWLENYKQEHPSLKVGSSNFYLEVSDQNLITKQIPWECSPLDTIYKKQSLASTASLCKQILKNPKNGDNCFVSTWWLSLNRADIDWSDLFVTLKKDRSCKNKKNRTNWWIYPDDTLQWSFGYIKGNYSRLRLKGQTLQKGKWRVRLYNDTTVFLDQTIEEVDFVTELILDIPVRFKKTPGLKIEISAIEGAGAYLFLESITLDN